MLMDAVAVAVAHGGNRFGHQAHLLLEEYRDEPTQQQEEENKQ